MIPASTGEYIIPKEVVARKGTQFFDNIVKKTLEEVMPSPASSVTSPLARPTQPASPADLGGTGTPETGYRWGGEVREGRYGGFGGRFLNSFGAPQAQTGYQDAIDPHPNFWGPGGGRPGGPQVFINREPPGLNNMNDRIVDNPIANNFLNNWNSFGYTPASGFAPGGPTMLPTFWSNYPGVGMVPMAVPPGGWSNDGGRPGFEISRHTPRPSPD
jgi:hypothetical protein